MGHSTNLISWGAVGLSSSFPKPATGRTLLLAGKRNYTHAVAFEMICDEICSGRTVHWIDGGMALDPSRLIPLLSKRGSSQRNSDYCKDAGLSQRIRWWI